MAFVYVIGALIVLLALVGFAVKRLVDAPRRATRRPMSGDDGGARVAAMAVATIDASSSASVDCSSGASSC